MAYVLGHEDHGHPLSASTGCTGTIPTTRRGPRGPPTNLSAVFARPTPTRRRRAPRRSPARRRSSCPDAVGQVPGGAAIRRGAPRFPSRGRGYARHRAGRFSVRAGGYWGGSPCCPQSASCRPAPRSRSRRPPPPPTPPAPGAPGTKHTWAPADKHGFGTAHQPAGNAYLTLRQASLSEVYFPDLSTPGFRGLQFAVVDGKRFLDRETVDDDPDAHRARRARRARAGGAARRRARLPPGHADRALAADEDVDHRSGARVGARARAVRVAHRQEAAAVRARRPRAGRRRQRRPRRVHARPARGLGRRRRERGRRGSGAPRRQQRLPRDRRAIRGATCRPTGGCAATTRRSPATSCRARAPRSTACASAS